MAFLLLHNYTDFITCIDCIKKYNKNNNIKKFNHKDIDMILKRLYNSGNIIYKVR